MNILKMRIRAQLYKLTTSYHMNLYKFRHWLFRWGVDQDGDLVLSIAGVLHFIKYKEHTLVKFGKQSFEAAPKWINS